MNLILSVKNELQKVRKASVLHFFLAVLAASAMTVNAVVREPLSIMTLSPVEWIPAALAPFTVLLLFYTLAEKPERSVFWSVKCLYYILVPFLTALLICGFFDRNKAELYSDSFYSKFWPKWTALWWGLTIAEYILMRLIGRAVDKGRDRGSSAAGFICDLAVMYTPQKIIARRKREGKGKWFPAVLCIVMTAFAVFLFTVTLFLKAVYSNMEFEAILFTVTFAAGALALEDVIQAITLVIFYSLITGYLCWHMVKCFRNEDLTVTDTKGDGTYTLVMNGSRRAVHILLSAAILAGSTAMFCTQTHFVNYVDNKLGRSTIYENYYVKPDSSVVTLPDKKRNLIFIYLESIENTYASREEGGSQEMNYISGLTELAKDKDSVSFSNTELLGGASVFVPAITYTQGSTVAQTSGIATITQFSQFYKTPEYPDMIRLEDILHDNGYEQLYIEGSKGEFSMYDKYVGRYENSHLFDRKTAADEGYTDEDGDYIWKWGIEDRKLIEITKELITDISQKDKPFFVTMYTMDTHTFESGHRCPLFDESIKNDYLASVSCTSKQITEFVNWIKQQPFYENTTVILVGDHLGNQKTTQVDIDGDYVRTTYNCFINPAKKPVSTKHRLFSSLDMFPTTLSAIGAEIKGDRLGLGTDLFSTAKTLCEELGEEEYMTQLQQTSEYYKTEFFKQ